MAACVAGEWALVLTPIESLAATTPTARAALITAIIGLAVVAVGVSVVWSMGLRHEARGLRLVVAVPVALSIALVVVLILEASFRARAGRG